MLLQGGNALGAAITKERRKLTQQSLVFAMLMGSGHYVDVAHGLDLTAMDDNNHAAYGHIFFLWETDWC